MKIHNKLITTVLGLFLGVQMSLTAQNTVFTYQGRLTASGAPATGNYDLTFTLFATNSGGSPVAGPVTNFATAVTNGLFTVPVDFGGAVFNGQSRWLEIGTRTNAGGTFNILSPRQSMTPTPYAIFASAAGNLLGNINAGQLTGSGSGLTNVNAASLNNLNSTNLWETTGNAGANPVNGSFLGTTDNLPLEFHVDNRRAFRIEPDYTSPNLIGGCPDNVVSNGVYGATIIGGGSSFSPNIAGASYATVLGGANNTASGFGSSTLGVFCTASGLFSIALGDYATASGTNSLAMGYFTSASGSYSTALGYDTIASGNYSTAMGFGAHASHDYTFLWSDSSPSPYASTGTNQFDIRANGGVHLDDVSGTCLYFGGITRQMINLWSTNYGVGVQGSTLYERSASRFSWFLGGVHTNTQNDPGPGGSVLMTLTASGLTVNGTFVSASDRNLKENFQTVDSQEVLAKVVALPVSRWNYKADKESEHLGPMAQDFYAAFQVGPDDRHITTIDEEGVALAAIKGLNQKLETENAELKTRLEKIERRLAQRN